MVKAPPVERAPEQRAGERERRLDGHRDEMVRAVAAAANAGQLARELKDTHADGVDEAPVALAEPRRGRVEGGDAIEREREDVDRDVEEGEAEPEERVRISV